MAKNRIYLQDERNCYRPLAWVRNYKPNEMMLGLYGLTGDGQATLRCMWPERDATKSELGAIRNSYKDRIDVGCTLNHITCHADGKFHVKTVDGADRYIQEMQRCEPLGADTSTFLELMFVSDLPEHYAPAERTVGSCDVWVAARAGHCTVIRGMFSGANYALEADMAHVATQTDLAPHGVSLQSGSIKGVLAGRAIGLSTEAASSRPRGTIVSFLFPISNDRYRMKTFLFE
jgi:hypothetical protein